jgi:hypothetical protein
VGGGAAGEPHGAPQYAKPQTRLTRIRPLGWRTRIRQGIPFDSHGFFQTNRPQVRSKGNGLARHTGNRLFDHRNLVTFCEIALMPLMIGAGASGCGEYIIRITQETARTSKIKATLSSLNRPQNSFILDSHLIALLWYLTPPA